MKSALYAFEGRIPARGGAYVQSRARRWTQIAVGNVHIAPTIVGEFFLCRDSRRERAIRGGAEDGTRRTQSRSISRVSSKRSEMNRETNVR